MPSSLWTFDFIDRSYKEETLKLGVEPHKRSLNLVAQLSQSRWHVRITFYGRLQSNQSFAKRSKRRTDLQDFCHQIDFSEIKLLDDTVTELAISRDFDEMKLLDETGTELVISHGYDVRCQKLVLQAALDAGNECFSFVENLRVLVREDPFRVRFPYYEAIGETPTRDLSTIEKRKELAQGVHEVHVDGEEELYVYKEIERPLYVPRDSKTIERELQNLELCRNKNGIMQLVAAVVSNNPYETTETCNSRTVLRGILLEHHPNGTLDDALKSGIQHPWRRWAWQISNAVIKLYEEEIAHMDLKPGNILIDEDGNTVVGDISGFGGTTREWLSPEMMHILEPQESEDLESKKRNDVWAVGKMISLMADASCIHSERQMLRGIAMAATRDDPLSRISLDDISSRLK